MAWIVHRLASRNWTRAGLGVTGTNVAKREHTSISHCHLRAVAYLEAFVGEPIGGFISQMFRRWRKVAKRKPPG